MKLLAAIGVLSFGCESVAQRLPVPSTSTPTPSAVESGGSISGRLLLDGKPVQYFGVIVLPGASRSYIPEPTVFRNEAGHFRIDKIRVPTPDIIIVGPGFSTHTIWSQSVTLGKLTPLGDIAVKKGFLVEGVVQDQSGNMVSGSTVNLVQSENQGDGVLRNLAVGNYSAMTDDNGHFEIDGVSSVDLSNPRWKVFALKPGQGLSLPEWLPSGDHSLKITLQKTGFLSGHVERAVDGVMIARPLIKPGSILSSRIVGESYQFELPFGDYELFVVGQSRRYGVRRIRVPPGVKISLDFPLKP